MSNETHDRLAESHSFEREVADAAHQALVENHVSRTVDLYRLAVRYALHQRQIDVQAFLLEGIDGLHQIVGALENAVVGRMRDSRGDVPSSSGYRGE